MTNDLKNFEEIRIKAEDVYKKTPKIFCPFFKEEI